MTLGALIAACQHRSGNTDSAYRDRWVSFINEAVRQHARTQPWEGLEDTVDLSTDGSKYLYLPTYVDTIVSVFNVTSKLPVLREGDFGREAPSFEAEDTSGKALAYDRIGEVPTYGNPTGYVWFKSSSSSDTQTISVTGLVSNSGASGPLASVPLVEQISTNGTAAVTLTNLYTQILSIARATESYGDTFFYDGGASNAALSFISRDDTEAGIKRIRLHYVPSAGTNLRLRFRYRLPPLRENAAAPHPAVKSDYVVQYALSRYWEEQEQFQKAVAAEQKATRVLEAEANKDHNFNEPWSRVIPVHDRDPDDWLRWG